MYNMTVKKLRQILSEAEEDAVVLISNGNDQEYRFVSAEVTTALKESAYTYIEDAGEEYTPEEEYGPRVAAVVIG